MTKICAISTVESLPVLFIKNVATGRERAMAIYFFLFTFSLSSYIFGCLRDVWSVWLDQSFQALGSATFIRNWFSRAVHSTTLHFHMLGDSMCVTSSACDVRVQWSDIQTEEESVVGFGNNSTFKEVGLFLHPHCQSLTWNVLLL